MNNIENPKKLKSSNNMVTYITTGFAVVTALAAACTAYFSYKTISLFQKQIEIAEQQVNIQNRQEIFGYIKEFIALANDMSAKEAAKREALNPASKTESKQQDEKIKEVIENK